MHFKMLSAICFNLDQSKIMSSGNELKKIFTANMYKILAIERVICTTRAGNYHSSFTKLCPMLRFFENHLRASLFRIS